MWYCNSQPLTSQLDFSLHKALLYLVSAKFFPLLSVICSSPHGFYAYEYICLPNWFTCLIWKHRQVGPSNALYLSENKVGFLCTSTARGGQIYSSKITGRDEKNSSTISVCLAVLATMKSVAGIFEVGIRKPLEILALGINVDPSWWYCNCYKSVLYSSMKKNSNQHNSSVIVCLFHVWSLNSVDYNINLTEKP